MFNFTTLTILNKVVKKTVDEIKAGAVGYNVITDATADEDNGKPMVRIGNIRFNVANVIDIQKKVHTPEFLSEVTIDFDTLKDLVENVDQETGQAENSFDGVYRIVIYVGLTMNSLDSFYANNYVYKGKPFFIEFKVNPNEEASDAAARAAAVAKKFMLLTADKAILTIAADTSSETTGSGAEETTVLNAKLTIKAVNGYQILKKVIVQKFDPNAKTVDCCSSTGDFVDVMYGVPLVYELDGDELDTGNVGEELTMDLDTGKKRALADNEFGIKPGLEAFGDYNWIIHNLRLPTLANTNFWSATTQQGEMPVVGGEYTQYIIRMCKDRDGIAGGVVGLRATSVTTHVFYVLDLGSNISNFESALANIVPDLSNGSAGSILTDADTALNEPFANAEAEA